ncbi:MAG: hypothetical protein WC080_00105 [Patescibacteria group bacterium]|jgi:hypothetical protein
MKDERVQKLEDEIVKIKSRNLSVELDKAWETSWARRILIAVFTYLAISLYLLAIKIDQPFLNAIVPTVGFMLSTLTLPWFRSIWEKNKK